MKGMANYLLFFFIFVTIGLAVWYMARRSAWLLGTRATWWYVGYAVAVVLSLTAMSVYAAKYTIGPVAHILTVFYCYLCAVLVILLFAFLMVDIVHLFAHFNKGIFAACVLLFTVGLSTYGFINAATPRIKEVAISLPNMDREITAVQLTDVHIGHFRGKKHLQHLVKMVNNANPELIFFTGDFIESWYNCTEDAVEPLQQLKAPVFFVDGNHDTYVDANLVKTMCRKLGMTVLENEVTEYAGLQIVGLDYMVEDDNARDDMHAALSNATIQSTMPLMGVSDTMPTIVLHHSPIGAKYMEATGADLFLAGHTHGGQFFPVTLIDKFLFEYNHGLYQRNRMSVYVSCGSGTFGLPLRIGTHSEVTLLHLKPQQ